MMIQPKHKLIIFFIYSILLIIPSMIVGYQVHVLWGSKNESYALVSEAHSLLTEFYLDTLPEREELERGMIRGMLAEIGDRYTIYLDPAAFEIQSDTLSGEYGGIGAFLLQDDDSLYHLSPFDGSPAELAGIIEGDILLAVDGVRITDGMNQDEVLSLIRGPVGTSVNLTIADRNTGRDEILIDIERMKYSIPSVASYLHVDDSRIAVIAISMFSEQTPLELEQAYDELLAEGMKAVILDLRDNSGGLLESAVAVSEFFLPDGTILYEQKKDEPRIQYSVENPGKAQNIPLIVIVNEGTASSAEIVAAALQANERSLLIGTQTFGKGVVQSVFVLKDGSSLYVTSARWMTPDLKRLDLQGLQPDMVIATDSEKNDPFLNAATDYLQNTSLGGM